MKTIHKFMFAAILGMFTASMSMAQTRPSPFQVPSGPVNQAPAVNKMLDDEGLRNMLDGIGYQFEKFEIQGYVAFKVTLKHQDVPRVHMVAIDKATRQVIIVGGGFSSNPDPKQASNAWFNKVMRANQSICPATIGTNDKDVLTLTSVIANVNITPTILRQQLDLHVSRFDTVLGPLAKELPSMKSPVTRDFR
ncbi:MAG: hypothetical protein K8T89_13165 [Planctomycetes bacterium]|nr:hypothetical protein [Planctomycetota bacterium]